MRKALVANVALALGAVLTAGCSKTAPVDRSAAPNVNRPVAKIGDQVITEGELLAAAKGPLGKLEAEHAEQVHAAKSQALDELIEKRLVEAQAKTEGITPEKLVEREVTRKSGPEPSAQEVQDFYERVKASGRPVPPFEMVKEEIAGIMKERGSDDARKAFIGGLRAKAKVETMLPPLLPPKVDIAAEGPSKGPAKAPVTIVAFSDFECPYCSRAEDTVRQVMDAYKDKVRLVYRDFPLPFHGNAQKASEAALCAGEQGKYWEMHAKLFANQSALGVSQLKDHAKGLGLDATKFDGCLDSGQKAPLVAASKKAGDEAGVTGTPAFFINGRLIAGAQPFERFKEIIDHELAAIR